VLNYASTKYGLDTQKGIALAQMVIWLIIHPDIAFINPQSGIITRAEIEDVFSPRFDLTIDYNIPGPYKVQTKVQEYNGTVFIIELFVRMARLCS
jgi:hypothetical protein